MIMKVQGLIDPKKKARAKDAIAARDGKFFERKRPLGSESKKVTQEDRNRRLIQTLESGDYRAAEIEIFLGADVNSKADAGQTPLMCAVWERHSHIVELLIEKGAAVNAKDDVGTTVLEMAEARGNMEIVEILREAGAKSGDDNY